MSFDEAVVVSCPGKVLLAGGYLVLDRDYDGLVAATPARFYAVLKEPSKLEPLPLHANCFNVSVLSPQFEHAQWNYEICLDQDRWVVTRFGHQNTFIDEAIAATVNLFSALYGAQHVIERALKGCRIFVIGDNEFYSQDTAATQPADAIHQLKVPLKDVHKTGLGSSAAMVTSLIGALAHFLSPPNTPLDRPTIHNLAQYVHSSAQGKIGSGFDVSAAVHGSHLYRRFDPACIAPLMDLAKPSEGTSETVSPSALAAALLPSQNELWTSKGAAVKPFVLPPQTRLMLADVDAGAHTPTMVSRVLKWRAAAPAEAQAAWAALGQLNADFVRRLDLLRRLHERDADAYGHCVDVCAGRAQLDRAPSHRVHGALAKPRFLLNGSGHAVIDQENGGGPVLTTGYGLASASYHHFEEVTALSRSIRAGMKKMGELAHVDIEPDLQTDVLDACFAIPGVLAGGVPGAGGLDAAWLLVAAPASEPGLVSAKVEALWAGWSRMRVAPLLTQDAADGGQGLLVSTVREVPRLQRSIEAWELA